MCYSGSKGLVGLKEPFVNEPCKDILKELLTEPIEKKSLQNLTTQVRDHPNIWKSEGSMNPNHFWVKGLGSTP